MQRPVKSEGGGRIKNKIASREKCAHKGVTGGGRGEVADRRKYGAALLRWSVKKKRKENERRKEGGENITRAMHTNEGKAERRGDGRTVAEI